MKKIFIFLTLLFLITAASAKMEQREGFPANAGSGLKALLVVQDIDGDGKLEIIAAPENRMVKVFDYKGTIKWENTGGRVQDDTGKVPLAGNLSGDSRLEVISYGNPGYSDPTFYIWDAIGNNLKSIPVGKYLLVSSPAITKDGIILTGSAPGVSFSGITQATGVHAFDSQGNKLWYLELGKSVNILTSIPVGDIDGDGIDEAVILTQDIGSTNPVDGKIWAIKVTRTQGTILWSKDLGGDARGAAIGDLNGDGVNEVVVASSSGVYILDKNGNQLYNFKITGNRASPAIGDIDGDGLNEVVIASGDDKKIYVISKGNLREFSAGSVTSNLALGDINRDGKLEIVAGDMRGQVYVWDYKGNLMEQVKVAIDEFTSAVIADLEGNGSKEIILGNKNGNIYVWNMKTPVPPVASISYPLNGSVYQLNSQIEFTSSSTDDGTIVSYKWESNIDGIIGNAASFNKVLSAGWHDITLTVTDNDGLSNSTSVKLKVNKPPAAIIDSPQSGAVFRQNDAITFNGTGTDEDGYVASYQWESDIDGILSNAAYFTSGNLSTGLHNITLTVTDNDGASNSTTIKIFQGGYSVGWDMKQKPILGEMSLLSSAGNKPVFKPGSMVPIKFTVSDGDSTVIDTTVRVTVLDADGREVFSAIYGSGSKAVRINEDGKYIANFKSSKNDPPGIYKIEVTFGNKRKNQDFSKSIYLLNQKNTLFMNKAVGLKAGRQGNAFTYEWKLNNTLIGNGAELTWVPDAAGIYNIRLFVTNNKKTDTEDYSVIVNAEADANGDDVVNVLDLSLLGLNWGRVMQDNDFDDSADVNGDGVIDILDAVRIGKKWT